MEDYAEDYGEDREDREDKESLQEENESQEEKSDEEKSEDASEEDDEEETEAQKFEDQIISMALPKEGSYIVVPKEERISQNILTKYEFANLISMRARQINSGEKVKIEGYTGKMDAVSIARYEIKSGKIPIVLKRYLPGKRIEIWDLDELIIDPSL